MSKLAFILGAPNDHKGKLSSVSVRRIETAIAIQSADPDFVLLATGGFGAHFNTTRTPHRELVYRHLEARGAIIDRADGVDLLSSNTVEDIAMIAAFADSRGVNAYHVITSAFHADRCKFIVECLAKNHDATVLFGPDPDDLAAEVHEHEDHALGRLAAQGGVIVGGVLYSPRSSPPLPRPS